MRDAQDHSTLKWIRAELDTLIDQARSALEDYAEGVGDAQLIDDCVRHLHQVRGTLQLVQLYGAAMLAEEMELVAGAIRDAKVRNADEASEALMLGVVHMPGYLEKLEDGAQDNPILVLPMLNELRAARGAALLSEVALFAPELEQRLTPGPVEGIPSPDLPKIARRLRMQYHKGLLEWYRNVDVAAGLHHIADVLEELEGHSGTAQVRRFFRVGRAATEGLRDGSITAGVAFKELFGKLDREVKRIIDGGEQAVAESPDIDLLKNYLFYVAGSNSENPLIQDVISEFGLDRGVFSQAEVARGREELQAPDHNLMVSIRSAVGSDLTAIKDGLDLFIRGGGNDMQRFLALEEPLRKVADTLGMVGQGALRERLRRQAERIDEIRGGNETPDDRTLMSLAGDILFIETSLENLTNQRSFRIAPPPSDSGMSELPPGEFEKLVETVLHEAEVDIARNKESIIDFSENPTDASILEAVPGRFTSVAGAFRIMGLGTAADLLMGLSEYVGSVLCQGKELPPAKDLDLFADAMTSIEYFMEAVTEGRGVQEDLLQVASEALTRLGVKAAPIELAEEQPEPAAPQSEEVAAEPAGYQEEPPALESVDEAMESESVVEPGPELELEPEPEPEAPAEPPAATEKPVLEEIDQEILDIFIEEAREELAVIQKQIPRWVHNQDEREAIARFRRSFHTLKGSGRLVGAATIGEFAWSIENLLNRVIDETVEVSPDILSLLQQTQEVIPELIDSQESGRPLQVDVNPIMEQAFALADPSRVPSPPAEAIVEIAASEAVELEPVAETEPAEGSVAEVVEPVLPEELEAPINIDPTLLDIFVPETRGHTGKLMRFVEECRADPAYCDVNQREVARALHTLHGSADMAEVEPIAAIGTRLEFYINYLGEHGQSAEEETLGLIERSVALIEEVLAGINVPGAILPDWQKLVQEIDRCKEDLQHKVEREQAEAAETAARVDQQTESYPEERPEIEGIPPEEMKKKKKKKDRSITEPSSLGEPEFQSFESDDELTEIFLEEARELMDSLEESLQTWNSNPEDLEVINDLERTLHTLKGGSRLAGAMPMGDLSHAFESLLTGVAKQRIEPAPPVLALARVVTDRLAEQLDDISLGPRVRLAVDVIQQLEAVSSGLPIATRLEPAAEAAEEELPAATPEAIQSEPKDRPEPPTVAAAEEAPGSRSESEMAKEPEAESEAGPEPLTETGQEQETETQAQAEIEHEPAAAHPEEDKAKPELAVVASAATELAKPVTRPRQEQIRVKSDLLDRLVNNAGEVSIYRARLEQQNGSLGFNLSELEQTVERLRAQLRKLEMETEAQILFRYEREKEEALEDVFDPLEMDRFSTMQQLSRSLMETVNDLGNINGFLDDLRKETDTLLLQQARVATDLQEGLLRTRMVSFSQLVPRLQRVVRQAAGNLNKQAELRVDGAEGELDRGILDRMIGPLEHILRNAVSHGVETPEARRSAGKDEVGHIVLQLVREGNDVILTLSDDGGGIDIAAIRRHAIELDLLDAEADVPESDILQFVLEHGFSTQKEVTQIAGRGVGLDIVVNEVKQLGGSLEIESSPGKGTSFIIRLPLTLAISDALLVVLGDEIYAIPHTSIEGVVRVAQAELLDSYEGRKPFYSYADHDYRVRYLGGLLGVSQVNLSEQKKWYPLLLVRAGEHRMALQVDDLLGNRQIVVKSVGPQISTVRWISGGTILGDGRVALILDVTALVRIDAARTIPSPIEISAATVPAVGRTVMVVDDSITVRKVTGRVLDRHGMNVITAKDGVDALTLLQEQRPDIMLLDIEMPRMDGYELARHMRNTEEHRDIPIIMITSRSGEKHRKLALELGVKRYLGKPYQETELLENINEVLAEVSVEVSV